MDWARLYLPRKEWRTDVVRLHPVLLRQRTLRGRLVSVRRAVVYPVVSSECLLPEHPRHFFPLSLHSAGKYVFFTENQNHPASSLAISNTNNTPQAINKNNLGTMSITIDSR